MLKFMRRLVVIAVDEMDDLANQPGERKPVMIPMELSEAAEALHLSYPETLDLLEAYGSIIARRSNRHKGTMTVEDWKTLHKALRDIVKKVYG
jgi:hypothetical protein